VPEGGGAPAALEASDPVQASGAPPAVKDGDTREAGGAPKAPRPRGMRAAPATVRAHVVGERRTAGRPYPVPVRAGGAAAGGAMPDADSGTGVVRAVRRAVPVAGRRGDGEGQAEKGEEERVDAKATGALEQLWTMAA
jgi:hypothetical protein